MLWKENNIEPCKEFNLEHFILHVTTTDGSIKNLYLLTDRTANETVSVFLVVQGHLKKKREAPQSHTPKTIQKETT